MSIAVPILTLIIPTVWAALVGRNVLVRLSGSLTRLMSAWFFGQLVVAWLCLCGATVLRDVVASPLESALWITLILMGVQGAYLLWQHRSLLAQPAPVWKDAACLALVLAISSAFYLRHLGMVNGAIVRSVIFWDFNGVFPLVQSFSLGNNFPPRSEIMSGAPLAYHFFYFLHMATYCAAGLDLVTAFNFVSAFSFAAVLLLVIGITESLSGSRWAGILAAACSLTSSSLFFADYLGRPGPASLVDRIYELFTTTNTPDVVPFLPDKALGYNGNMTNLFYFLEERQLSAGCVVLLLAVAVLRARDALSMRQLFCLGLAFGMTTQWHLFTVLALLAALPLVWLFGRDRRMVAFAAPLGIACAVQLLLLRYEITDEWYLPRFTNVPLWNPTFSAFVPKGAVSPTTFAIFWVFLVGVKVLTVPAGLMILRHRGERSTAIVFSCMLGCMFVLTNTVQLSPLTIYENHKWLRPGLLLADCLSGLAVCSLLRRRGFVRTVLAAILVCLLTLSGILEGIGFLRRQRLLFVAMYPSEYVKYLTGSTRPSSVIVSEDPVDIFLAGRRSFVTLISRIRGNPRMEHNFLRIGDRIRVCAAIYLAPNAARLCTLALGQNIDLVEFSSPIRPHQSWIYETPCTVGPFVAGSGELRTLLDVACLCPAPF